MDIPVESSRSLIVLPAALRRAARRRRALLITLTLSTSAVATFLMHDILKASDFPVLERLGVALFFVLFTWITVAFWTALAGFAVRLGGRDRVALHASEVAGRPLRSRTAVVMPIYNEDTVRVAAGLDVIWRSLEALPEAHAFDLFILSDTRKPEIAVAEEQAWRALVARHGAHERIYYRRRKDNVGRKAGNIADFLQTWGGAYDHAVVLDADSIMTGEALVTLARLMEAHPTAGIIQALPLPAGRQTLFARLVQFAARLHSPMLSSGLAYWQLSESNYWGHNAILRVRAFTRYCGLPRLRGSPPLGGEILSHDFVEAAFMRRAGFQVWLVADLAGSYEEIPSNLIDYAARDRRWTQGNLQHLALLPARGLHWVSRLHLVTGVLSYVSSPLWLLMLALSSIAVCWGALEGHQYFAPGSYTLFPSWPEYRDPEVAALLTLTLAVLFLPRLFGAALAFRKSERAAYGGAARLSVSVLIEQLFSMLLAPAMMMFHTSFVLAALAGKSVSWHAQERGDRGIGWREALARHGWHVLIGAAWCAAIALLAPAYVWWVSPVVAGLILSAPLTVLTSRASAGGWLRRRGLLLTPEETRPPQELRELADSLAAGGIGPASMAEPWSQGPAAARAASPALRLPARAPLAMEPAVLDS